MEHALKLCPVHIDAPFALYVLSSHGIHDMHDLHNFDKDILHKIIISLPRILQVDLLLHKDHVLLIPTLNPPPEDGTFFTIFLIHISNTL